MSTQVKAIIAGVVIVGVLAFSLHYTSSRRKAGPAELGEGAPAETAKTSGYGVDEKEGAISSGEDDAVRGKQPKVETSKSETTGEKSAKKDIAAAPSAVEKTGVSPSGEAAEKPASASAAATQPAPSAQAAGSEPKGAVAYIKSILGIGQKTDTAPKAEGGVKTGESPAGQTAALTPGSGSAGSATAPAAAPEPQGCFTMAFKHKKMMAHSSDEACSHHKNQIKLKHAKINTKSICVRVDGKPVKFAVNKKDPSEITIAGVAGPDAKITARYCVGKAACNEECKIPKDEFMAAIGATDDLKGTTEIGHWELDGVSEADAKKTAKINTELKRELASLDEVEPGTSEGVSIFRDWVGEEEGPACGTQQARLGE